MSDDTKIILGFTAIFLISIATEIFLMSIPPGYLSVATLFLLIFGFYFYSEQTNAFPFQNTKRYYYFSGGYHSFGGTAPIELHIKKSYINYDFDKKKFKKRNKRAENILASALAEAMVKLEKTSVVRISSTIPIKLTYKDIEFLISSPFTYVNMLDLKVLNMEDFLIEKLKNSIPDLILPRAENFYYTYNN